MQGFHHPHHHSQQQQSQPQHHQLTALLAAALPKDASASPSFVSPVSSSTSSSSGATVSEAASAIWSDDEEKGDSARLAAVNSLHRAIIHPSNSLLVAHSASFLIQGLFQLLSDKFHPVRHAAAAAYGALCAVICSVPINSNGRPNPIVLGSLVDRFIGWAIPLLGNRNAKDGNTVLAVDGLKEFLSVGDVGIEGFVHSICKAVQALLEDERISFPILQKLLDVLTLISGKFPMFFQPLFLDIIDVLLGWVLVPDLPEADKRVILDSFLQFQKQWVTNLQFSVGLMSKFINDMDVLLLDDSPGSLPLFQRLLSLLSCFCTVLQSTASGLLEINLLQQMTEPLTKMVPQLLRCLSTVGIKFDWANWMKDCWKCLTLLAEILGENFCVFYPVAADLLFQSLTKEDKYTSIQIHQVLKINLQLLSLQKAGLLPSAVQKNIHFDAPVSKLRLHPNHLVTGTVAATYVFLLQNTNDEIFQEGTNLLFEELQLLKEFFSKNLDEDYEITFIHESPPYLKHDLLALIKFDLKILLASISLNEDSYLAGHSERSSMYLTRSEKLTSFIIDCLNPFDPPVKMSVELQVHVLEFLERITVVELTSQCFIRSSSVDVSYVSDRENDLVDGSMYASVLVLLRKYEVFLSRTLDGSSSLAIKLVGLKWVRKLAKVLITNFHNSPRCFVKFYQHTSDLNSILFSVLDAASDKEPQVRLQVPLTLETLFQSGLINPVFLPYMSEIVVEKLSDPDIDVRTSFVKLFSYLFLLNMCTNYSFYIGPYSSCKRFATNRDSTIHWKQVFALTQLRRQLQSQQLVSVLSYISQRWKVPLSSWIQRFIHSCKASKEQPEDGQQGDYGILWNVKPSDDILEKITSVDNLAGAWWAIHEAARYCISTRLRTNLGGPTQTFAAIERMLLDISLVLQLEMEQIDRSLSMVGSSGAHLLPMRLLLNFVEALKKNVYNAYEGSGILNPVSPQSSLFFRANRRVCEEWFSRICEPMMNAGLALQCHYATIQYSSLRLTELQILWSSVRDKSRGSSPDLYNKLYVDITSVLQHMALAVCRNHEPEVLLGLQQWASFAFPPFNEGKNHLPNHNGMLGTSSWLSGLIFQAEGQYERAAAHFVNLMQNEESIILLGSDGIQFVIARIIECYACLADWKSLDSWLIELQSLRTMHAGKNYCGALTTAGNEINAIHALARFDGRDFQASWTSLNLTLKSCSDLTLDPKLAMQRSEQMFLHAMLHYLEGKVDEAQSAVHKSKVMLDEILSVLPLDGAAEAAPYAFQLHCISVLEEACKLKSDKETLSANKLMLNSHVQLLHSYFSKIHLDCTPWMNVLRVYKTCLPMSILNAKLSLGLSRLARKQGNIMMSSRLNTHVRDTLMKCSMETEMNSLLTCLQYEEILLLYSDRKFEDAFSGLWSFILPSMVQSTSKLYSSSGDAVLAKACLKLTRWVTIHYPDVSMKRFACKVRDDLLAEGSSSPIMNSSLGNGEDIGSEFSLATFIERLVGKVAKLSTKLCPTMSKAWIAYASWCFSLTSISGRIPESSISAPCSFNSMLDPEFINASVHLTTEEQKRVQYVVNQFYSKAETSRSDEEEPDYLISEDVVNSSIQQIICIIETTALGDGAENYDSKCLSASVTSRLKTCLKHSHEENIFSSSLDDLLDIWWSVRKRCVTNFGFAATGFAQCLRYLSSTSHSCLLFNAEVKAHAPMGGSYSLRAILYLLHIILNYGVELKSEIDSALSLVPLTPWQEITPQLFARLSSHPEQIIRKQLGGLLMMLAKLSPSSVVFPTLVDVNTNDQFSEEREQILACLRQLYPNLVKDVQLMMNELENVTVLWEELWLSTIQDLHADVVRRINVLREEASRTAENTTLSQSDKSRINAAKYSAMMAPIVVALERRLASTTRKPETPHEIWFNEEYNKRLQSAIVTFKSPPASATVVGDMWRPFEDIAASLASYQRKSTITLEDVAPWLSSLSSSNIPMPGLEQQSLPSRADSCSDMSLDRIVTISSLQQVVSVLPTKTKPKKLFMIGSDGNTYTYLLKGREDLRLDARIMQFLQAVNAFVHSTPKLTRKMLAIRHYSVTPISSRAGLIQWVENVISIYSVFKAWQNRIQAVQLSGNVGSNTMSSAPPLPRPSDMFYGKIIPALKEKGIRRVISRSDWPQDVKRKVLLDLMKEVPKQLLHQELWCASEGFKAFHSKLKRFSGSVASMSVIGHVLGLGDRHLDNILVDFCSGQIVHIDYNICFDKGQRLKIPEIVPFRLTQVVEGALGLTGVEGSFRSNCEAVIDVLRKNKDVLLMLLEAFVWDPLIEWTRGDFHDEATIGGEEKKGMESAVSLSLFASRVHEIRVPLQAHRDVLLATLPAVKFTLERFDDILNEYNKASTAFVRAEQECNNLAFREAAAKVVAVEATSNLENSRVSFEFHARELAQAKSVVAEMAKDTESWMEQHGRMLDALKRNLLPELDLPKNLSSEVESLSLTGAILVAGAPVTLVSEPILAKCQDIDDETLKVINDVNIGVSSALIGIKTYSIALQKILPMNYLATSCLHGWSQVLHLSANASSADTLSLTRLQAAELIRNMHKDTDNVTRRHDDLHHLIESCSLEIEKIERECTELTNSIAMGTENNVKDRLRSALMDYVQFCYFGRKVESCSGSPTKEKQIEENKLAELSGGDNEVLCLLNISLTSIYNDVKQKILGTIGNIEYPKNVSTTILPALEEQIEKCYLVCSFFDELWQLIGRRTFDAEDGTSSPCVKFPSVFKTILLSCSNLIGKQQEMVVNLLHRAVSMKPEVLDAFGSISQIRGSIDMALERLLEVELEKLSMVEFEKNYFVQVGLITEKQLTLEEAAVKGRDNLSWEEADELASQEEACKTQLNELHKSWNQRELKSSSLMKMEANVKDCVVSSELRFHSLVNNHGDLNDHLHLLGSEALLPLLNKVLSELESAHKEVLLLECSRATQINLIPDLVNIMNSGESLSENIWKFGNLLNDSYFFIWKVCVMDSFINLCVHDVESSVDQNQGFEHLLNAVKNKLNIQLEEHIGRYLKEFLIPTYLAWLHSEIEHLKQLNEMNIDIRHKQGPTNSAALRKIQILLEEYCNAHEITRAERAAASTMKRRVRELNEARQKAIIEVVQLDWIYDGLIPSPRNIIQDLVPHDENFYPMILNLNRPQLLESINSAATKIATSLDHLQTCEQSCLNIEGQLERAMTWAETSNVVGDSSSSSSAIPLFHENLMKRHKLLWDAKEKASGVVKTCLLILEFEASRDGIYHIPGELYAPGDGRSWHQSYLNTLTKLEVTYHSFGRAEKEWKIAEDTVDAASKSLHSAANGFSIASTNAKSVSGDLQKIVLAMSDTAYEASVALTTFGRLLKDHCALTSESGTMLEEVLAITEDLPDVHKLGREAAVMHHSLMENLFKVNGVLLPLEALLSKDVTAMADALTRDRETSSEVIPIHGKAIYNSYNLRIREAIQTIVPLIPPLELTVESLFSMLMKLARTASLHAGNLHKALEGLAEGGEVKSSDITLDDDVKSEFTKEADQSSVGSDTLSKQEKLSDGMQSLEDKGWLSPPDSVPSTLSFDVNDDTDDLLKELVIEEMSPLSPAGTSENLITDVPGSKLGHCSTGDVFVGPVEQDEQHPISSSPSFPLIISDKSSAFREEGPESADKGACPSSQPKAEDGTWPVAIVQNANRVNRGKNAYAMSVLKKIEMKIDGLDISNQRKITVEEQVDYLLKQAMSIDNLCNMYEGWTPWI